MKRQKLADGKARSRGRGMWQAKAAKQAREGIVSAYPRGSEQSKAVWGPSYRAANSTQQNLRKALRYKGDGDYREVLNRIIPKGTFARVGGMLGRMSNIPGLDEVGHFAGNKLANYVGFGDYDQGLVTNQLIANGPAKSAYSSISVNPDDLSGDIIYSHSEFVQNITASASGAGQSAFELSKFPVNPGLAATFPFLSQLAQNFEIYEFHGLVFQYKPTSGESGASSNALGKVIMAVNYDPTAADFINSVQMENYDYASSTKPSVGMVHGVETDMSRNITNAQFIRTGSSTKQLPFTDLGNLYVATEGVPFSAAGSQIVGELWVSYKIRLSRSNLYGALLGSNIGYDFFTQPGASGTTGAMTASAGNSIGCTCVTGIAGGGQFQYTFTFPVNISLGYYLMTMNWKSGTASAFDLQGTHVYTNCSYVNLMSTGTATGSGLRGGITYLIKVTAPGKLQASVSFLASGAGAATPPTYSTTYISQANVSAASYSGLP